MTEEKKEFEINILDYLIIIAKRKKIIVITTLIFALLGAVTSIQLKPPDIIAETTFLPPEGGGFGLAKQIMATQLGALLGMGGSDISGRDLYIELLRSRTMSDRIIDRFDLMKVYKLSLMDIYYAGWKNYREGKIRKQIREQLQENLWLYPDIGKKAKLDIENFLGRPSRLIKIEVRDKDPKRAADMANAFAEELQTLVRELSVSEALKKKQFFDEQLKQAKEALTTAEENMKGFQEKTGLLQVETQAKALLEAIAELRARIAVKEVELKVMKTYSTPNNPDFQRGAETITALKAELAKLEAKGGDGSGVLLTTGEIPYVGTEYVRKLRELKYSEKLNELMTAQYESAKIDEAGDPGKQILIIDKAIPSDPVPYRVFDKKRVLIVAFTGFITSFFLIFLVEYYERTATAETREKIKTLRGLLTLRKRKYS